MESVCWFCRKDRHSECMVEMPVAESSEGPHDCSFGTKMVRCSCSHRG